VPPHREADSGESESGGGPLSLVAACVVFGACAVAAVFGIVWGQAPAA